MSLRNVVVAVVVCLAWLAPTLARAGGAWVPTKGDGDAYLGYSWKTADASWNPRGDTRVSQSWHIFRYVYTGGEVGLGHDLSFRYLVLWLDGLEGRRGNMEHNAGFSEAFLGLKYGLTEGTWPMAVAFNVRTSYLYDLPGTYDRHLFDEDGNEDGVSPEWRGLLGEDYGVSFLVSRSLFDGGGWTNLEVGYNHRTTNLSDEIPLYFEIAYPLAWQELKLKGSYRWVQSVGNHDLDRAPDDRFGCSPRNCFPDASMMYLGVSLFRDLGRNDRWYGEAGFNQWIWGRSARKYEEPYFVLGRRF
ncbi:MAG TPA: hypothetical protein VM617_04690 [Thermoanaerobaculia bacterium]|nr:hypothetical protein [Thermoanaerobaculia bacterium]